MLCYVFCSVLFCSVLFCSVLFCYDLRSAEARVSRSQSGATQADQTDAIPWPTCQGQLVPARDDLVVEAIGISRRRCMHMVHAALRPHKEVTWLPT